ADGQHRIEARHRLLENHRNVVAANGPHPRTGVLQEIGSLEADRACDLAGGLGDQSHQRHRGDRLAAAGFADDGERLAFTDMEGDTVDGAVDTLRGAEMGLQALDFEQCHRIRTHWTRTLPWSFAAHERCFASGGWSASRRPSPTRLTASTVTERNAAGKNTMKGL